MFITEADKFINGILDDKLDFRTKTNLTLDQSEKYAEIINLLAQAKALSFDLVGVPEKIKRFYLVRDLFLDFEDKYNEKLSVQFREELKLSACKLEYSAKILEIGLAFHIAEAAEATKDKETQIHKRIEGFNLLRNLVDNSWKEVGHYYEQLAYDLAEAIYHTTPTSPLEENLRAVQQECLTAILRGIKKFDKFNESLKKGIYKVDKLSDLYEIDFYAWTQEQANSLREKAWRLIDIPNLVEEVESLGKQQRQELRNRLGVLLGHLLKWEFQESHRSKSWFFTIKDQRREISILLKESPSLNSYLDEALELGYQKGLDLAVSETSLKYENFPNKCPYKLEQILNPLFPPGIETDLLD